MSYRQGRQDIRTIPLVALGRVAPRSGEAAEDKAGEEVASSLAWPSPLPELRRIAIISFILLIGLGLASYLEITHPWVIPLAKRLLSLGS